MVGPLRGGGLMPLTIKQTTTYFTKGKKKLRKKYEPLRSRGEGGGVYKDLGGSTIKKNICNLPLSSFHILDHAGS